MTSIEGALYSRIVGDPGASALLSTRVYPDQVPKGAVLPYARYQRAGTGRPSAMGSDVGLAAAAFQIDVWAADFDGMLAARAAVRAALQRWRDEGGSPAISDAFIDDERSHGFEQDVEAWRGALDVRIWARE